jgi:peptide/nickel transport system ATP-binding protein
VKAIADEIVVMYQGRVVQSGSKTQVLTDRREYTDKLLSSVPEMDPDWLEQVLAKRPRASA